MRIIEKNAVGDMCSAFFDLKICSIFIENQTNLGRNRKSLLKISTARREDGPLGRAARTGGAEAPAGVFAGAGAVGTIILRDL